MNFLLLESRSVIPKKKKIKDKKLILIGQSNLPFLNRSGIYMYWDNSWLNNFNKKFFLDKTLFLERIFFYLLSDKLFNNFCLKKTNMKKIKYKFFKFFFLKKLYKKYSYRFYKNALLDNKTSNTSELLPDTKHKKYNFTRLWFVKYNDYILLSSFCFFFFKVKKVKSVLSFKRSIPRNKTYKIFFKKRKSRNFTRKKFFLKNYLVF